MTLLHFGFKTLSHGAIFLATCNTILFLRDLNLSQMFVIYAKNISALLLSLKKFKFVTIVWYAKNISANCDGNMYLQILHFPRVELHCKPVWKVCIVEPRSRLHSFDVPYIFYSKFSKSRSHNLQTFQSGLPCVHSMHSMPDISGVALL